MQAEHRKITVERHEYALEAPAHYTEVVKAIHAASAGRDMAKSQGYRCDDVMVGITDEVVVSYTAERG